MAGGDKDFVSCVDGQAGRRFAGREWPGIFDLESPGVKFDERAFVLEIDEDLALAVGRGKFRVTAERNGADKLSRSGVHGRCGVGLTVESEDALGKWIVNCGVGALVRLSVAEDLEGSEVEDSGVSGAAVGGEPFVKFIGEGDSVDALSIGNISDDFSLIGVDDDDVSGARDKKKMRGRINFEI